MKAVAQCAKPPKGIMYIFGKAILFASMQFARFG